MFKPFRVLGVLALLIIICGVGIYKLVPHKKPMPSPHKPILKVKTINFADGVGNSLHFWDIINKKYEIHFVKDRTYDVLVVGWIGYEPVPDVPGVIRIYYSSEPFATDFERMEDGKIKHFSSDELVKRYINDFDLVMSFEFIDRPNYIRVPYSYFWHKEKISHDYERKEQKCLPQNKKYFTCFLVTNGGSEEYEFNGAHKRNRLFHLLSLYKPVVSGGKHLNNIGGPIPRDKDKTLEWLSQCKFTIAYENDTTYPGYVTEKPFQAWDAGTIPIYDAHPAGLVDMNKKALIYAGDFATEDELVEYIKKVDNDDKLYCDIWNQHLINDPQKDYKVLEDKIRKKLDKIFATKLKKQR